MTKVYEGRIGRMKSQRASMMKGRQRKEVRKGEGRRTYSR